MYSHTKTIIMNIYFLILSFRRVLYVICFLLGNSTSADPGNHCYTNSRKGDIRRVHYSDLIRTRTYTGCPRRNVPDFGRVFLMLKYTDITQNTYVQSRTVTEIMAREVWNFDICYTLLDYQIHIKTGRNMWFL